MTAVDNLSVTVIANQLVDIVINMAISYVYDNVVPPPVTQSSIEEQLLLSLKDLEEEEDTVNLKVTEKRVNNTMDFNQNLKSSLPKKPQGRKEGRKRSVTFDPKFIKDSEEEDDISDNSMNRHKTNSNTKMMMTTTIENKAEQNYIDLQEEIEITRL